MSVTFYIKFCHILRRIFCSCFFRETIQQTAVAWSYVANVRIMMSITENDMSLHGCPVRVYFLPFTRLLIQLFEIGAFKVNITRNFLFPCWKDLLKLYGNIFCSFSFGFF